jgi:ketosteroid isomerase-like protein
MSRITHKHLPAILLLIFMPASYAAAPAQLKTLDQKWADATMHADLAALNTILSDDLTYTHSSGETQTKAEFIASIRSKELQYHSIEFESAEARSYGNTAIISSHVRVQVTASGHDLSVHACFLHVWIKKNDHWQLVAHQATKLD